ncbi:MAG: outer membrane protein assembly factor BamD [Bacteroidales bacterium]
MRKFGWILLTLIMGLSSCKSSYEALLESGDTGMKYDAALDYFNKGKYVKSATIFEALKLPMKGTIQEDTVLYFSALSYYYDNDIYSADPAFASFISIFPRSPFTESARFYYLDCAYRQTYRYELDQNPTHSAINKIKEFKVDLPTSKYIPICDSMLVDLNQRLAQKEYEGAKLYYQMEDYKAAKYALKNVLKENANTMYREDISYYIVMSSYHYADMSVSKKRKERFLDFSDAYYNFVGEFPNSKYRKELDTLYNKIQEKDIL